MNNRIKKALLSLLLLTGCSSFNIDQYQNEKPLLKLDEYLNGDLVAHGVFLDRSGNVKRRFTVDLKGTWKGNTGTLEEDFKYSDGSTSRRVWTIVKKSDRDYVGTADDVIGEAKGTAAGNALFWEYYLNLEVDGSTYKVKFDDWMYLMDDKVMLNKSKMSKFGIYLGEVVLSFYKK